MWPSGNSLSVDVPGVCGGEGRIGLCGFGRWISPGGGRDPVAVELQEVVGGVDQPPLR
jgi:hypothetical protein